MTSMLRLASSVSMLKDFAHDLETRIAGEQRERQGKSASLEKKKRNPYWDCMPGCMEQQLAAQRGSMDRALAECDKVCRVGNNGP